jgi:integrase
MRGHVRKRGKTWSVVYDEGRDEDGKRKQRWKSGYRTREDAENALADIIVRLNQGAYVEPTKQTTGHYLDEWLEAAKVTLRPSTFSSYKGLVDQHIKPGVGTIPLQKLTGGHLNALYSKMLDKKGRKDGKGGLSPRTVSYAHAVIHRALRDAVRWNRLPRNVADSADPPKATKPPIRRWDAAQLRDFLKRMNEDRLYAAYLLIATTGMRRGEAFGLRWQDVDFEAGQLSVRQTLIAPGYKVQFSKPKTAKGNRSIALDPTTVAVLKAHRKAQIAERLALGADYADTGGLVFTELDGSPVNPVKFSKQFERAVKAAGLPRVPLHGLRHTWATVALSAGIHPKVVSERLGHATISLTLDTYSDVLPGLQEEAAAKVAALVLPG